MILILWPIDPRKIDPGKIFNRKKCLMMFIVCTCLPMYLSAR